MIRRLVFAIVLPVLLLSCAIVPPPAPPHTDPVDGVSFPDLYRLFHMCSAAWRQRERYHDSGWNLEYLADDETNTLVLLIEEHDTLYVVFRGSQFQRSEIDRRYNSMIIRKRPGFGSLPESVRTHMGFTHKYLAVRDPVLARIGESSADRIVTVGHSAGGALALLAFVDLLDLEPQRISHTVNFGMPRLFNRAGARELRRYKDRVVRVVNGSDVVTRVPIALFGYRHTGTLVQVGDRSRVSFVSFYDHNRGYTQALRRHVELSGTTPDPRFESAPQGPAQPEETNK